ncbi:hypothetical protein RI129_006038 [Pyrocoelia pectoralis]|uniref:Mos1 transposase HTH domain-containing protein n=1 Tax=Pyrocoelia pectoralis TaxID=417401 RepID=A0AAN7ZN47_9COLE
MEKRNLEQRVAIKFCAKLGNSATETYDKILKVYGGDFPNRAQVFRWRKEFKDDRESVEDEARSGRPVDVRTKANAHPNSPRSSINECWLTSQISTAKPLDRF